MIGVIANKDDQDIVCEFFELFKTQWEFYNPDNKYDVLIVADNKTPENSASLVIIYSSKKLDNEDIPEAEYKNRGNDNFLKWEDTIFPVYGDLLIFKNVTSPMLHFNNLNKIVGYENNNSKQRIIRVGYNLFKEVFHLLTIGQPPQNSLIPSLDIHISMLRNWIIESGLNLFEIPPIPAGYTSIACLTHDVDFIGLRKHFLDHSVLGFLYRATVRSTIDYAKGKLSFSNFYNNLKASFTLPFIYLGICRDPWNQFENYFRIENGRPSTFYFIPYKNRCGEKVSEKNARYRAAKYDVDDIAAIYEELEKHGCEAGVHGIDSWHSDDYGKKELNRISNLSGKQNIGIRMHWLCQDGSTYQVLDKAGYSYDSTFGYNDAVGFKAGTAQAFKPLGVNNLMELPMHIQDSALFNRGRMNVSDYDAIKLCDQILECVNKYKGVLTVLWHQRSLAPERLWGDFYSDLIKKIAEKNAWFATGNDVISWFKKRRSARFKLNGEINSIKSLDKHDNTPPIFVRNYLPGRKKNNSNETHSDFKYNDRII